MFKFFLTDYRSLLISLSFLFAISLGVNGDCQMLNTEKIHFIYHMYGPFLYKTADGETRVNEEILLKIWNALRTDSKTVDSALLLEVYEMKDFEKVWPPSKLAQYSPEQTAMTKGKENILNLIDVFKQHQIPFWLAVYPPMGPAINPDTLEAVYKSAGELCRGIVFGESYDAGTLINPLCWSTALQYIKITQKYNKKLMWFEHAHDGPITSWPWHYAYGKGWWGILLYNDLFKIFFNGETKGTIVPGTESNDPRGEIYDLMAVLGIWHSGLANEWGASIQNWFWHDSAKMCKEINKPWCQQLLKEMGLRGDENMGELLRAMPPNLVLRFILTNASLGARYFEFEGAEILVDLQGEEIKPSRQFNEAIKPFIEMVDKGIINIPRREELLSLSPVALKLTDKDAWFISEDGMFMGRWEKGDIFTYRVDDEGKFSDEYFFKFAYNPSHPLWYIPATPYGIVPFLPKDVSTSTLSRFPYLFTTNLYEVWEGKGTDKKVSSKVLRERLKERRKHLVFQTDKFFLSAFKRNGKYYCYVIDPDEVKREDKVARIVINKPLGSVRVVDLMEGKEINRGELREFEVDLPAERGFSILMIERI